MAKLHLLLLVALFGTSFAVPISKDSKDICASECPVSKAQKLNYLQGMSYHYDYAGTSSVILNDKEEFKVSLDWTAQVTLSWLSPCQVSVLIRDPVVNGHRDDPIIVDMLTRKAMVATIKDGVVVKVCADGDDHPASLNMKKGVISSIQNVLPAMSQHYINKTVMEDDVLGRCPTLYTVSDALIRWIIRKRKDHKECSLQHASAAESPVTSWWLRSPVIPLNNSYSDCLQFLRKSDNVLTSVICTDVNVVRVSNPSYVSAIQTSKLTLKEVKPMEKQPALKNIRVTNLTFEVTPEPITEKVVPEVKSLLKKLCISTSKSVEKESATELSKIIDLLYRVPKEVVKELLTEIRKGVYCKNSKRLESLFLDAIAYVGNAGAVQVMVEEVTSGKVSGGRIPLYTIALHLLKKPCIMSVKEVMPLFTSDKVPSSMVLAAGSLVGRYCKFHPKCLEDAAVKSIMERMHGDVESKCPKSEDQEQKLKVLTSLKAIGNIARITKSLNESIVNCIKSRKADVYVRVAATQAYRHVACHKLPTSELLKLSVTPSENPEVRIASYVAAIRCSTYEQAEVLVSEISRESNTQVRSFILSHLRNLQKSDAPYLRGLRYTLATLLIPTDYEQDPRKYSKNFDLSYYLPSVGVGGGVETSLIYAPGSFIPRQIQANVTADLFNNVINVGEFSLRIEHLEALISSIFGPDGHFQNGAQIKKFMLKHKSEAMSQFQTIVAKSQAIVAKSQKTDAFARIFGQEVLFSSNKDIKLDEVIKKTLKILFETLYSFRELKLNSARALRFNYQYFVATSQGIPLNIKTIATAVLSLEMDSKIKLDESKVQFKPCLSFAVNGFVGYTIGAKAGIRTRVESVIKPHSEYQVKITNNKVEVVVDFPAKFEVLNVDYQTFMMTKLPSKPDTRLAPNENYPKFTHDACANFLKSSLGLKLCLHISGPDYTKANIFPLGDFKTVIDIEKQNNKKEVLKFTGTLKSHNTEKQFALQVDAPGSNKPTKLKLELESSRDLHHQTFKLYGKGPSGQGRAFQVNIETLRSYESSSKHIFAYYGTQKKMSSSNEVFEMLVKTSKQVEGQFKLKTKHALAKVINADVDVNVAMDMRKPIFDIDAVEVRKCEIDIDVPNNIKTINYIRKGTSSNASFANYEFKSLTKTPLMNILDVTGVLYMTKRSIDYFKYEYDLSMSVKTDNSSYKVKKSIKLNDVEQKFSVFVKDQKSAKYIVYYNVSFERKSRDSHSYNASAELQIPSIMRSIEMEGGATEEKPNSYKFNAVLKRERKPICDIKADLLLDSDQMNKLDIEVKPFENHKKYNLSMLAQWRNRTLNSKVTLRKNGEQVFNVEGELDRKPKDVAVTLTVAVPQAVDVKLVAENKNADLSLVLNGFIRPNTPESQQIKGTASLQPELKVLKARLAYDMLQDPKKKVGFSATYDFDWKQKYVSVRGDVDALDHPYKYNAAMVLGSLAMEPHHKNKMKFKLTKPDQQEIVMETSCMVNKDKEPMSFAYTALLQLSPKKIYKVESLLDYDFRSAPYNMMIKGQTKIECPKVDVITVDVDTRVDIREKDQQVHYMMIVSGPKIHKPIKFDINFRNMNENPLNVKVEIDMGGMSDIRVNGVLDMSKKQQKIEDISMLIDVKLPKNKDLNVKFAKKSLDIDMHIMVDGSKILAYEQSIPESGLWKGKLTTNSRIVEANSHLTPNSMSATVYPNRKRSDDKYAAEGHYQKSETSSGISHNAEAKFNYPGSKRGINIKTELEMEKVSSKGLIELDIFRNANDKVTVEIRSYKKAESSYKVEADIKVPRQSNAPRLDIEIALSEEVKSVEILVRKSPSVAPLYTSKFGFSKISDKISNMYISHQTPSRTVEMISDMLYHELFQCRGGTVNGTIISSLGGSYDFVSAFCAPGYVDFGAKESKEDKMFIIKLGMKNPASIEAAIDLVYNSSKAITTENVAKMENTINLYGKHEYLPKIPMLLASAKLWLPMIVTVDGLYNVTGLEQYLETVSRPTQTILREIIKELRELPDEIVKELVPSLPDISSELSYDLKKLGKELYNELISLQKEFGLAEITVDKVKEFVRKSALSASKLFETLKLKMQKVIEFMKVTEIQKILKSVDRHIQKCAQRVYKESKMIIAAIESGSLDEMKKHSEFKWIIENVEGSSIWKWIKDHLKQFEEKFKKEWRAIQDYFRHSWQQFKDEINTLINKLKDNAVIMKIIKWIESWTFTPIKDEDPSLLCMWMRRYFNLFMSEKNGRLSFQIPLQKPVSSLSAAISSMRSETRVSDFSMLVQSTTVHPYTASAKLNEKNLVTFDGLVIPLSFSKCDLLLTKVSGDVIVGKKVDKAHTELSITLKSGKFYKILLQAGRPPKIPQLKGSKLKAQGITINKVSEEEINIELKGMTLLVKRDVLEIKASPWSFSKMEGLMGNYDGEKATDAHRGALINYHPHSAIGKHHMSKDSAKKLLEQYRMNHSCKI